MVEYLEFMVLSKAEYEIDPEATWDDWTSGDYVVFGLATKEDDNKFHIVYLEDNTHSPEILPVIDAYLVGVMRFSPICGERVVVVVDNDHDRYHLQMIYEKLNNGEFYDIEVAEEE